MKKLVKYVIIDILRNKIVLGYTLFLLVVSLSVFNLEDNSAKGLLSLLNIILIIVPLLCIIFATIYVYNSAEFIELLVSQPVRRTTLLLSIYTGLTVSLMLALVVGVGVPVLLYDASPVGLMLMIAGLLLTAVFTGLALLASVLTRDKAKGIGLSILLWFYFAIIFDGLILFILFQFADYLQSYSHKPIPIHHCFFYCLIKSLLIRLFDMDSTASCLILCHALLQVVQSLCLYLMHS